MSITPDISQERLLSWAKNGKKENPKTRLCFGGVTSNSVVHLKTNSGELITYPLNEK